MNNIKVLCDQVRQTAYDIHVYHGHGHLEKVYENALAHRLAAVADDCAQRLRRGIVRLGGRLHHESDRMKDGFAHPNVGYGWGFGFKEAKLTELTK